MLGFDVNAHYLATAKQRLSERQSPPGVDLRPRNFFEIEWHETLSKLLQPVMIVGNPPWVTSSRQGGLDGVNLPAKSNFLSFSGLDAKTGKSNFDIAEWMSIELLEAARGCAAYFALLLKTSVARRVLKYAWSRGLPITDARLNLIDAQSNFGVSADAGLLYVRIDASIAPQRTCLVFKPDNWESACSEFGMRDQVLVANVAAHDQTARLRASHPRTQALRWRSGIKHDCGKTIELVRRGGKLFNQVGECVDVELEWVYPLLKGSDVANGRSAGGESASTYAIVTQRRPGDDTLGLATRAPRLWRYLCEHGSNFDSRRSSIYRQAPRFAMFGIGPYTFAPWKIAICGLYKRLSFRLVGPFDGRPVVLDDTCYQLSFDSQEEAGFVLDLLHSDLASTFFHARLFWDAKRPITAELLQQLDLLRLADELGKGADWDRLARRSTLFQSVES